MKQYLIDEETLKNLLVAEHCLTILKRDGVDNWPWFMKGYTDHLVDCMGELSFCEGMSREDLVRVVEDEDYDLDSLVEDQITAFWIPIPGSGDEYGVAGYGDAEHS